jgi:CheY-like chemotaxis protein/anti-sigma regulatory factor (Ser/Thr protein kinase)
VINGPASRTIVMGDPIRITQIIANLVSNAARYTHRGGHIAITVGAAGEAGFVRVADDGVGIPQELQHSIFEMFVQERVRSDGSGGLGLGLALAKRLVEMHNGSISASSAGRDRGSVFEIQIPRVGSPLALPMRRRTRDMQPLRGDLAGPRSIRMLVIDDNDDARELLSELLRRRGCEVLTADDGPAGVQLLREQQPDVALVDIGLPTLDGFGVIETALRECPELKTRLVALTGYGQSADHERTRQAGFHAHLVKPATAEAILACLSEQLGAAL